MALAEVSVIALRAANADDSAEIWRWRNDPRVRAVSSDSSEIPWTDHCDWYARALRNPDRAILIGLEADAPCGCVRFDRSGDAAVVSVFLDPQRMGEGLGAPLLRAGEDWLRLKWPTVRRIEATILPGNTRSTRAFAKAGYVRGEAIWIRHLTERP